MSSLRWAPARATKPPSSPISRAGFTRSRSCPPWRTALPRGCRGWAMATSQRGRVTAITAGRRRSLLMASLSLPRNPAAFDPPAEARRPHGDPARRALRASAPRAGRAQRRRRTGDDEATAPGELRAADQRQLAALTDAALPGRRAGIGRSARLRGAADPPLLDRSVAPLCV